MSSDESQESKPARKTPDPHEYYPRLLEAYREEPNNHERAAKRAGVSWGTAEKAWKSGHKRAGLGPIVDVIRLEQQKARAMLAEEEAVKRAKRAEEERKASEQAIQGRKEEGQITRVLRASVSQQSGVSVALSSEAFQFANALKARLKQEREKLELWINYEAQTLAGNPAAVRPSLEHQPLSLPQLVQLLNRVADYTARLTQSARAVFELERLYLGEPLGIIGIVEQSRKLTPEEVEIRERNAIAAIQRAKERRGLVVLDGGKTKPVMPVVGQRVVPRS